MISFDEFEESAQAKNNNERRLIIIAANFLEFIIKLYHRIFKINSFLKMHFYLRGKASKVPLPQR